MEKVKILFLAANPSQDLRLDEEIREITSKIRAAEYRDALELVSCWAVRPDDLRQALLEHQPHVLHFSGHGSPSDEIILQDDDSNPHPVSQQSLIDLLRTLSDNLQLVVLNACYSRPQAEAIAEVVDCTIGMDRAIDNEAAILFAAVFYQALGFGRSVQTSFELGLNSLTMEGTGREQTLEERHRKLLLGQGEKDAPDASDQIPQLITRQSVDASKAFLVGANWTGEQIDKAAKEIAVVPRGLRHFDEHDAGFFLKLLPGPYREDGLPESLHFWKTRIEETDADKTFRVGVIHGPSGCGKSSLVRAGLIPHLDDSVISIIIDATPNDTERQLLGELKKHAAFLNPTTSLRAALQHKDEVPTGRKLLIVLDQFEQWLHGRDESAYEELSDALRECDGTKIQCLLLIREDFWTLLTEFMDRIGERYRQGDNAALVNRFSQRHAKHVLIMFGQADGALPESGTLDSDQSEFVDQAIDVLAENGRVICVQLALYFQMVRRWDWTPATLKRLGGTEGVGVAFLEESLAAKEAPASVRQHQQQAEAVLRALLPEQGTDIKGARRSRADLLEQSGYGRRPDEFSELLEILDTNLRLITPNESIKRADDATGTETVEKHYQLTHDYLVPSLREWLTRKQKETRRGRAELCLAEHAHLWKARQERRFLPGPLTYMRIFYLTSRRDWTDSHRSMMRHAAKFYSVVSGVLLLITFSVGWGGLNIVGGRTADAFVNRLSREEVETRVKEMIPETTWFGRWTAPILEERLESPIPTDEVQRHRLFREQSNAAVALLALGQNEKVWPLFKHSADPTRRSYLIHRYAASGGDRGILLEQLAKESDTSIRRALVLTLGNFDKGQLSDADAFIKLLLTLHEQDPDPGIHGATEWVLRRWQREKWLAEKDRTQWEVAMRSLATGKQKDGRQWYVTSKTGHTMVVLPGGEYWYGEPLKDGGLPERPKLDHGFAISTTEVTVDQFRRFLQGKEDVHNKDISPHDGCPVNGVSWYPAAEYCNWLSGQEGIPKDQWCYEPNEKYADQLTLPADYLKRTGYRLPTEEEWEYACRAGSSTRFGFGEAEELLPTYARYSPTHGELESTSRVASLKPNDFGLFDMHGNIYEWCPSRYGRTESSDLPESEKVTTDEGRVLRGGSFLYEADDCRSAYRYLGLPDFQLSNIGFRVSRTYN